ncbi:hypothetical protein [Amycolatopsis sp. SID8362]|uniref:hypothetical protein n=1 Tax=Amycolatopsis sp. SID8362 TaxID=2690346 RepID=UPI001367BF15|nr:hypothetical protein [Amycolatopsis sp. SID8362]NBH11016.1 hypothetical protein [Amycolatopsis sp. SID8362]NED47707.1 hypothetical protein [Amycolatopsis sp. SID8362]
MDVLQEKGLTPLRAILGFSLLTTTLHYAHNVVRAADYPPVPGVPLLVTQVVVAFGWVLFTVFGWLGYRAYRQERYPRALVFLLVYSLSGLASAGHFLVGVPQVPAFWFATIFTDSAAALALWVFVTWAWSVLNRVTARDQVSTQH